MIAGSYTSEWCSKDLSSKLNLSEKETHLGVCMKSSIRRPGSVSVDVLLGRTSISCRTLPWSPTTDSGSDASRHCLCPGIRPDLRSSLATMTRASLVGVSDWAHNPTK
jgi:hypothetical protein